MALYKGNTKLSGVGGAFTPEHPGQTGQVLKKTATGYDWDNDENTTYSAGSGINIDANNEISSTVNGVPAVGTNGQVLTVVSGAAAWANAPATGITNNTTGTTSTVSQEWVGTAAEYSQLSSYGNIIYNIIE